MRKKFAQHTEKVDLAYRKLSVEQQNRVDAVSATAVPYEVFKYSGPTIVKDGQKLTEGALVFIDPQAKVRKRDPYVPVWLIRGLEKGWRKAISVSRDFLTLVPFAAVAVQEVVEVSQRTLARRVKV